MKLFILYLRQSLWSMAAAVVFGAISGLTAAALLALINHALAETNRVGWMVWAFAALCTLRFGAGVAAHAVMIRLSQKAITNLRMNLCRRLVSTPLRRLEEIGAHRLVSAFTDDVLTISQVVVNIPYFLVNIVVLLGCLAYLGTMSAAVLAGVLACFMLGVATYLAPVLWANRQLHLGRQHQDELFRHFSSVVHGAKELKLHAGRRDSLIDEVLGGEADAMRRANERGITVYATAANWNRLLFFVYVGALLFALPSLTVMTPGAMAGLVLVLLYMMAPLEAIMNTAPHIARASVSLAKIEELGLSLGGEESTVTATASRFHRWQRIDCRSLEYRYSATGGETGFQVGPVDLSFRRGEVVFLIGGNGSGKTTLVKLITGLYLPESGTVAVDGRAVDASEWGAYRQIFSGVFTDYELFDGLMGVDPSHLDERAKRLLRTLRLNHKVSIDGGRFSTTTLSQGQRKRLALATALLEDRCFYVLDEWAADQDPEFRRWFYEDLVPDLRAKGKTVLVATHDDRYFHLADRQIKLENGRVVEERAVRVEAAAAPSAATV